MDIHLNGSVKLAYAMSFATAKNQTCCGDKCLVKPLSDSVLIAIADGLGHGNEAELAAETAIEVANNHAEKPLSELLQRCHLALTKTRGAVLLLARIDSKYCVSWLGIGNITGLHWQKNLHGIPQTKLLLSYSGIAGVKFPAVTPASFIMKPADTLVLATDGISADFIRYTPMHRITPHEIVTRIFSECRNTADDALAVVIRRIDSVAGN